MTYRDQCNFLHKIVVERLKKYYKAEASIKESTDEKLIAARNEKYKAWQEARSTYDNFLTNVVHLGKTLDDKVENG